MATYSLTADADRDLTAIYFYTFDSFGENQADLYTNRMISAFELLAQMPFSGRKVAHIHSDTRSFPHESHVIYYEVVDSDVVIIRILHHAQDPLRQFK
ncbi:hypothetical protein ABAC460_15630 [Asticcacaulis sp. AC460]|uniref:type II toxin-antitoxin system RelE/ParE family toxin n=1 Tax=Asticcacaulis sp. AC460 TaxID=1282360 RepID=UPI0003C3FFF2|nr:type II toxin-antitoxin system RelE/ParE family toxin [Asticcacaulis sp. AC460]ESQ88462.1 hypothetical protein ABAC460_15630 [Asticcacaulis sp. AC460]